jgi:hypothetical protein
MTKMLVPADGAKGIDIDTGSGVKKINADERGRVNVEDPKLARVLKAEGFTVAGLAATFNVEGFPCACGHLSIFKVCGKCGAENGNSDKSDNESL